MRREDRRFGAGGREEETGARFLRVDDAGLLDVVSIRVTGWGALDGRVDDGFCAMEGEGWREEN